MIDLIKRMKMQDKIGNNQKYLGNGLTEDLIGSSPNKFGVVETLNFERNGTTSLQTLKNANAIAAIPLG